MPEMPDEFHIASLLVQRAPRHAGDVRAAIAGMPGAEVQIEEGAKLVVPVEAARAGAIADMVTAIQLHPGVMRRNQMMQTSGGELSRRDFIKSQAVAAAAVAAGGRGRPPELGDGALPFLRHGLWRCCQPFEHRTFDLADTPMVFRPGTDLVILNYIANHIITTGRVNHDFVDAARAGRWSTARRPCGGIARVSCIPTMPARAGCAGAARWR